MMANIKEFFLMNIVIPVVDKIMGMKIKNW